jgi:hypothetical protein
MIRASLAAYRDITKVLFFRTDISPFLVHLTRDWDSTHLAKDNLIDILTSCSLRYTRQISDAKYGVATETVSTTNRRYFSAMSFTETPLGEIHNLMDIAGRYCDLKPYGLVFLKDRLKEKGVSPVIYINNMRGDQDDSVRALCSLIDTHPNEAARILPFVAVFGKLLSPLGGTPRTKDLDFTWEREWRYACGESFNFNFDHEDVFLGLCPHEEIRESEERFSWLKFIDPYRNIKWYSEKVLEVKETLGLKHSIV